jgi:voltage-gated potassium channel
MMPQVSAPPRPPELVLPERGSAPLRVLITRIGIAAGLILGVAMMTWLDRGGYRDTADDSVNFLDALYYSTVSVTTTGYGDITPVSDSARLLTTLITTPARVIFLVLLVGTTLELLAARSVAAYRERRWRRSLGDHTILCGFGKRGRAAAEQLIGHGTPADSLIAVDIDPAAVRTASDRDIAAVEGDASQRSVLLHAGIESASTVVVAVTGDDTAVLVSLTARELNPDCRIVAAVAEDENAHLMEQSGANAVVRGSTATGRLLAAGVTSPHMLTLLDDLLVPADGLKLFEREVTAEETGPDGLSQLDVQVLGVVRGGELIQVDDPRLRDLRPDDRLLWVGPTD